jgi:hypothetical protein
MEVESRSLKLLRTESDGARWRSRDSIQWSSNAQAPAENNIIEYAGALCADFNMEQNQKPAQGYLLLRRC